MFILDAYGSDMTRLPIAVLALGLVVASLLTGCNTKETADAQGNFEADEVTVSPEVGGKLLRFAVEEGDRLPAPADDTSLEAQPPTVEAQSVVGLVDTTRLSLQRRELRARRRSIQSKINTLTAEADVFREQLRAARRELERARTLREGNAAPEQTVDQAEDEVRILEQRIEATASQKASLREEVRAISEQIAQVDDQIRKRRIVNPVGGTVLKTYVEKGEVVRIGEPLYTIASLDTLTLRAYVSGSQLSDVRLGQRVQVSVDTSRTAREARTGRVIWIASEAEFTPTPIQTRDERVDFVYAVKIRVPNADRTLKIGMPADVSFGDDAVDSGSSPKTTEAGR